ALSSSHPSASRTPTGNPADGNGLQSGCGAGTTAFNRSRALDQVEGDEALLQRMIGVFSRQAPRLLHELAGSIAQRNAPALERAAHKLKSSVGNFAAERAFEAAFRLERIARGGDLTEAEEAYRQLDEAVRHLLRELEPLAAEAVA